MIGGACPPSPPKLLAPACSADEIESQWTAVDALGGANHAIIVGGQKNPKIIV
jgi:hypothetical protein